MKRHHRALAEADQRKPRRIQPVPRQLSIEELIERHRGAGNAGGKHVRVHARQAEPLAPGRILLARARRMGRRKGRIRQQVLPHPPDLDEIIAVGAIAVQQHDERVCSARLRRDARPIKRLCQIFPPIHRTSRCPPVALANRGAPGLRKGGRRKDLFDRLVAESADETEP